MSSNKRRVADRVAAEQNLSTRAILATDHFELVALKSHNILVVVGGRWARQEKCQVQRRTKKHGDTQTEEQGGKELEKGEGTKKTACGCTGKTKGYPTQLSHPCAHAHSHTFTDSHHSTITTNTMYTYGRTRPHKHHTTITNIHGHTRSPRRGDIAFVSDSQRR